LSLLSVAVIWGVNIPIMKIALDMGIDRFSLNGLRLVVSAASLLIFATIERRSGVVPDLRGRWPRILCLRSARLRSLPAPVSARRLADHVRRHRSDHGDCAALDRHRCADFCSGKFWEILPGPDFWLPSPGPVLVTLSGSADNPDANVGAVVAQQRFAGNIIALLAAIAWSGGTILSRPMLKSITPLQLAAISTVICLPMHLGIAWQSLPSGIARLSSIPLFGCLLYSGVLSTGLAMPMWSYGVKYAGAAHATMFQNLSPIVAIVSAWLILGESVSTAQAFGGALILGGLFIVRRARARADPANLRQVLKRLAPIMRGVRSMSIGGSHTGAILLCCWPRGVGLLAGH
jgi:drug/metabolite transporter (DMT)-like permease